MPLLTTSRFKRPARGLVAIVAVGALGGPVGSAGAGVPAALPGNTSIVLGTSTTTASTYVTDLLGTHQGAPIGPLGADKARRAAVAAPTAAAATTGCSGGALTGGGFSTKLASTWTSLAARVQPCTSSAANGTWTSGVTFAVSKETPGQFICKGSTYGYGSSIWFKTSKGWAWSGGTTNPRWNGSC